MHRSNFFIFILLTLSTLTFAQQTKTFTFSTENSFFLNELSAIVQSKDGKIVFEMLPEQVLQQEKFKDLDLKKGDEILFINGKKVKELTDLGDTYSAIEVGKEIKLGIRRGKEQFFATLIKEEQQTGGGQTMIIGGAGGDHDAAGGTVMMNGKEVDLDSLKKANNVLVVPKKKKKGN